LETSLSRQSVALVLITKNKKTKHYIHPKRKRETEKTPLTKNYTVSCTGTDKTTKNKKTKHYIHPKRKRETEKTPLTKNYTLIWYAFYDLQPENGAGPIVTAPERAWGPLFM